MQLMKRMLLLLLTAAFLLTAVVSFAEPSPTLTSLESATVKQLTSSATYNGKTKTAKIRVTLNGEELKAGVDYVVTGNITKSANAGKYTLKVKVYGIGKYTGILSKKLTYTIKKASQTVTGTTTYTVKTSTTSNVKFKLHLSAKGRLIYKSSTKGINVYSSGAVMIKKNMKPGTYKIKVYAKATKNYKQSAYKTITIKVTR